MMTLPLWFDILYRILMLLAAFSIHEFGHHTVLKFYRIEHKPIILVPWGFGFLTRNNLSPLREYYVLIAGFLWSTPFFMISGVGLINGFVISVLTAGADFYYIFKLVWWEVIRAMIEHRKPNFYMSLWRLSYHKPKNMEGWHRS